MDLSPEAPRPSGFLRWSLTPIILLFAVFMPLLIQEWTPVRVLLIAGIELACVAGLVGLWLPGRVARVAFRGLAGLVALAYGSYLIHEFFFTSHEFKLVQRRSETSPRNALLGFIIIGVPCLIYAILGRLTLKKPEPEPETEIEDDASDEREKGA